MAPHVGIVPGQYEYGSIWASERVAGSRSYYHLHIFLAYEKTELDFFPAAKITVEFHSTVIFTLMNPSLEGHSFNVEHISYLIAFLLLIIKTIDKMSLSRRNFLLLFNDIFVYVRACACAILEIKKKEGRRKEKRTNNFGKHRLWVILRSAPASDVQPAQILRKKSLRTK